METVQVNKTDWLVEKFFNETSSELFPGVKCPEDLNYAERHFIRMFKVL